MFAESFQKGTANATLHAFKTTSLWSGAHNTRSHTRAYAHSTSPLPFSPQCRPRTLATSGSSWTSSPRHPWCAGLAERHLASQRVSCRLLPMPGRASRPRRGHTRPTAWVWWGGKWSGSSRVQQSREGKRGRCVLGAARDMHELSQLAMRRMPVSPLLMPRIPRAMANNTTDSYSLASSSYAESTGSVSGGPSNSPSIAFSEDVCVHAHR